MSLTKIGSIGINTGIAFAGVTTITTLNGSDAVLSVGGTVNFVSDVSIGGTVSIAGTLTYEDVTNVDAVGLITARDGIVVGSGVTLSKDGDIFATGIITATSFVGSGANLTGVASTENIRTNTNATFLQNVTVVGTSTVTGNIVPSSDSATDIGTNSVRFQNIYGDTLYGDGSNLTGISAGVSLSGSTDNTIVTVTGANAIAGESTLTYDAGGMNIAGDTDRDGIKITQSGNNYGEFNFNSNRSSADNALGIIRGEWNSSEVASIYLTAGDDTTNKDDGKIKFFTSAAGGSIANRMEILNDGDVKITDGDLVIGTAGHGIDFSAQTPSSATGASNTAEILDHYEEGSWTPTTSQGAAHTVFGTPTYTRIGRQVTIVCYINITSSSSSDAVRIDGLPFTAVGSSHFAIGSCYTQFTADKHVFFQVNTGAAYGYIYTGLGSHVYYNGTNVSGGYFLLTCTYFVA